MATYLHNVLGWHATYPGLRYPVTISGIPVINPNGNKGSWLGLYQWNDLDSDPPIKWCYLTGRDEMPGDNVPAGFIRDVPFIIPKTLFDLVNPYALSDLDRTYQFRYVSSFISGVRLATSGNFVVTPWPFGTQPSNAVAGAFEVFG